MQNERNLTFSIQKLSQRSWVLLGLLSVGKIYYSEEVKKNLLLLVLCHRCLAQSLNRSPNRSPSQTSGCK